jgi:predicted dehydrogenase
MLKLGVIGLGGRIQGLLEGSEQFGLTRLAAVTDPCLVEQGQVTPRGEEIRRQFGGKGGEIRFYSDPQEMLNIEELDGVMVGTRGYLHTPMAVQVLARNLPLYLEKPVATNLPDLMALKRAGDSSRSPVVVSFPLRVTPLARLAKEIIDSGQIGTVEHVQANNNVPYGGVYYHYWYRDERMDGGLWLAKTTHDFDYINHLLGIRPRWIFATESKQVFKGDYPAGLACQDCADQYDCPESPFNQYLSGEIDAIDHPAWTPYLCSFATDTGNQDSGSALIGYETGMHVSYSQNFYARKGAAKRGAVLMGYKGTIEFDWYTSELKVYMHHTPRVETHKVNPTGGHLGGDQELVLNFIQVMQGKARSIAPLEAGILSALMCFQAKESVIENAPKEISAI